VPLRRNRHWSRIRRRVPAWSPSR